MFLNDNFLFEKYGSKGRLVLGVIACSKEFA